MKNKAKQSILRIDNILSLKKRSAKEIKLDSKLIKIIENDVKKHKKFLSSKLWIKASKQQILKKNKFENNKLKDNFLYHWEGFGKNIINKETAFFYKDFLNKHTIERKINICSCKKLDIFIIFLINKKKCFF